nr:hypothetical protein [Priestia megaterium]
MRVLATEETIISKEIYLMYKRMGLDDHETAPRAMGLPLIEISVEKIIKKQCLILQDGVQEIFERDEWMEEFGKQKDQMLEHEVHKK